MYWLVVLVAIGWALATRRRAPRLERAQPAPSERIALADGWNRITKVERVELVAVATGLVAAICLILVAVESLLLTM